MTREMIDQPEMDDLQKDKEKKEPTSLKKTLTEKMIDRSTRYKGRKDVTVEIRQKDK